MDLALASASKLKARDPKRATAEVDKALDIAKAIWRYRNEVLKNSETTWYKSWFPRVSEANGRRFLHELDDVKDHLPDRTVDLSYLVYREKLLPFWGMGERHQVGPKSICRGTSPVSDRANI